MRRLWIALCALTLLVPAAPATAAPAADDIEARLRQIPGLTVVEKVPVAAPYEFFRLTFTQPADHRRPGAGTFEQRLTLLHRGTDRPMVLHTTGYGVPAQAFRSEPTRLIDGNQISVEQRFFTPSRPEPADWSKLTIWQAATDHHRLVRALKSVYSAKWISTGASKGGMTSVYHRRFYPSDVDGTVAYVAPQDTINAEDSAYDRFFRRVGTDRACRAALDAVQVEALHRRATLVAAYADWATANGRTFTIMRSADRAFELMVNGAPWAFWQYSDQSECGTVPPVTASDEEILTWLDTVYSLDSNTDQGLTPYIPYYFQASYQLGYPVPRLAHLAKVQRYRGQDRAESYIPADLVPRFQPFAMADVDLWVRLAGRQLLFVYGGNDPWGAEPFRLGPGTRDSLTYTAAGANHGANIGLLTPDQAATATAAVQRWAAVSTPATAARSSAPGYLPSLDDWNPALDRRYS
jgi:hypothetical protein